MERLSDILQTFYINITAGSLPNFSGCLSSFKIIPADSQYFEKRIFCQNLHASRGVLPYSLGGGVPLGLRKSYPLLDQILQIL